ncbi:hypothetical protein [Domibacillus aminovorans]|uniref:ABC transporter permease n=1 Tax=Domibacillus aminovorans TaxID=29332 RepID=A0A177L7V7_9BACI|nr:hypothetical protein [Domibacillus aminovorans]OAH61295.1 ABC transporter permease [Domibacillus aminovorans]
MNDHKHDCKKKEPCKDRKLNKLVRASAFRATKFIPQPLIPNVPMKVLFENQQFDLANEYNPIASRFVPRKDGVYSIIATIAFDPAADVNHSVLLGIRVNGINVAVDNDFFGPLPNFTNILAVTTILNLNARDQVEVFAQASVNGIIVPDNPTPPRLNSSHFEAARFPSPK